MSIHFNYLIYFCQTRMPMFFLNFEEQIDNSYKFYEMS